MSIEYADEKLMEAVYSLATGVGRAQERLQDAAMVLIRLKPEDFPEGELRRTFSGVVDDLTYVQGKESEGNILATLKITDDEDARAIAQRIIELHFVLRRIVRGGEG